MAQLSFRMRPNAPVLPRRLRPDCYAFGFTAPLVKGQEGKQSHSQQRARRNPDGGLPAGGGHTPRWEATKHITGCVWQLVWCVPGTVIRLLRVTRQMLARLHDLLF